MDSEQLAMGKKNGRIGVGLARRSAKPLELAVKIVATLAVGVFAIVMIVPYLWMISTSFKVNGDVFKYPIDWIPTTFHWENYKKVWTGPNPFYVYYWNSIKITGITVAGNLL